MEKNITPNSYHNSFVKKAFDFVASFTSLIILSPVFLLISALIKIASPGSAFFKQKRIGKDGKVFTLIKFRTMRMGAERERKKLRYLNEADGPVFKIHNDPRYTKFGKILARTGLDELPQLINVLKGEMSMVGPRPLPIHEVNKLTKAQKVRGLVKPGITSSWVISGAHKLKFAQWMKLDRKYLTEGSLLEDVFVTSSTLILLPKLIFNRILAVLKIILISNK